MHNAYFTFHNSSVIANKIVCLPHPTTYLHKGIILKIQYIASFALTTTVQRSLMEIHQHTESGAIYIDW